MCRLSLSIYDNFVNTSSYIHVRGDARENPISMHVLMYAWRMYVSMNA